MRTKEHVKREILAAIDRRAEQIVSLGGQIRRKPQLGFKEGKTARLVEGTFAGLGRGALKAREAWGGRIVFFAAPAEEYGDVEWRVDQARQGKLEFLGGKPELLRLGHFDDVDLAMMIHTTARPP